MPVDVTVPQHGVDQSHQLPSSEDEGPSVVMSGGLFVFALVVGTELRAIKPDRVGSFDEVVAKVSVAGPGEWPIFALELTRLMSSPSETGELGHRLLAFEPRDVPDLGNDARDADRSYNRSKVDATTTKVVQRICKADLIVIDDIGMLPAGQAEAESLYRLVDAAYEKRSLAVTSNIHPSGFDTIMPKALASPTVDRLLTMPMW